MEIPAGERSLCVRELWKNGMGWDLARITPFISQKTKRQLMSVVLDNITGSIDRMSWSEQSDGSFTVKSAYAMLTRNELPRQNMEKIFDRIWRVIAPERVRVFFWLVVQQAVMTNSERHRRHLCESSLCQVCNSGEETILHVLRDCPAMSGVWQRLVPPGRIHQFFVASLLEWAYGNLKNSEEQGDNEWATMFVMAAWWGWKWRCGDVFGMTGRWRDRVRFIKDLTKEVLAAHRSVKGSCNGPVREERMIAWSPPAEGWTKLNTDGASRGNPGLATAGGVLRDGEGAWRGGFALNIGICSAPLAELWGVYYGLYIAWERGYRRVELEVDSEIVVGFLTTGISPSHPLSFLVRLCHGFISRDWIVRIAHVYREANRLADGLANYAFTLPLGFHLFNSRLDALNSIVLEDAIGSARLRNIPV
ncbi:Reverse transcriptase zinc-binding domain [Arabidopsis suecica]|uniref:Reverse transcriptase zinc-binding domain n=1 Tax=Arabidopsis suecica TaxID=45249 RepID=A0A8T2CFQ4_ARASU|nr:Reverse transcriptase zinc-binding domain [Arabidopsis suecica]